MLYSKLMILTLACCSVLAITHQSAIAQSPIRANRTADCLSLGSYRQLSGNPVK